MNTKRYLAMFPGQGSQALGMGKKFFESNERAKRRFEEAEEKLGFSLTKLCFEGPLEELSKTQYAQPAILTVGFIAYEIFLEKYSHTPTVAAGHSLGEYTALVAAGVLSFSDAVLLVHKRGLYMQEAVAPGVGSMLAILGKDVSDIEAAIAQVTLGSVSIANVNAPGQIVIAGEKIAVDQALEKLTALSGGKVKAVPLPVSVPSHTILMKPAAEKLSKDFANITFNEPKFPVYSNVTGKTNKNAAEVRETLLKQLTAPVQWVQCVTHAITENNLEQLVEFGNGQVLCGLAKRIAPEIAKVAIDSPEALGSFKPA